MTVTTTAANPAQPVIPTLNVTDARALRPAPGDARPVMVRADGLGKCFRIYRRPLDRLVEWLGGPHRHTDFWAVRGIGFEVRRGECLGIIGANGSGKSTLLKMICGALYPTEGTFEVKGLVLSLIELGTGLNPHLSGRANIIHAATMLGFPADFARTRMEEIRAFADLDEFFDRPVNLYSTGMRVRLAFSMFACFRPEVYIVDEALSVGDVFFQQKCATRIRELLDDGMTMIFVSHDQSAVMNLCDRVMVLSHGAPVFYGEPEEALSRYVAALNMPAANRWSRPAKATPTTSGPRPQLPADAAAADTILARDIIGDRRLSRHGTGHLRVAAARVTNSHGFDTVQSPMGETLSFHVLLEAHDFIESPRAGVRFFDRFNTLVFGAGTFQTGNHLPPMRPGDRLIVRFDVTMNLEPGQYTFGLGAGEPADGGAIDAGLAHDRIDLLGPLIIGVVRDEVRPFYGKARLPLRVTVTAPAGKEAP